MRVVALTHARACQGEEGAAGSAQSEEHGACAPVHKTQTRIMVLMLVPAQTRRSFDGGCLRRGARRFRAATAPRKRESTRRRTKKTTSAMLVPLSTPALRDALSI